MTTRTAPTQLSTHKHPTLGFALATAAVILGWLALASPDMDRQIALASWAMFAYTMALLSLVGSGAPQFGLADFRLGSWMLAFGAIAYGLATMSIASTDLVDPAVQPALAVKALVLMAAGYTAFALAYRTEPRLFRRNFTSRLMRHATKRVRIRSNSALLTVYLAGVAATGLLVVIQGGYGYIGGVDLAADSEVSPLTQPIIVLTFLRTAAVFGLSIRWSETKGIGNLLTLASLAGAEVVFGLLSGVKESFVTVALAVGIPIVLARRRVPWTTAVAGAAVFVLLVTPFVTALRSEVRGGGQRLDFGSSVALGLDSLLGNVQGRRNSASGSDNLKQITSRIRLVDNTIVIVDQTPRVFTYRPVDEVLLAPITGVVPRAIWPSKPLRLSGLEFYKDYFRGQGISSSAITMQGSLFMHGGVLVLIAGMFALGLVLRDVDDGVGAAGTPLAGMAPLILFIPIVKQELDVVSLLASTPIYVLTFLMAVTAIGGSQTAMSSSESRS